MWILFKAFSDISNQKALRDPPQVFQQGITTMETSKKIWKIIQATGTTRAEQLVDYFVKLLLQARTPMDVCTS